MPLMMIESIQEFEVRHSVSGPPVVDPDSRQQLFPDGAICSDMGMAEPPDVEAEGGADELLRRKYRYWTLMLAHEENQFYTFRAQVIEQANYAAGGAVPLPGFAVEQLKAGKARIESLRKKVKKLDAKVANLPEEVVLRERRQLLQERERHSKSLVAELQAVTLDGDCADVD